VAISLRQFNSSTDSSEPLKIDDEAVKTYMEMSPRELEHAIQQAVYARDVADPNAFVTVFDENGRLCRHYDDGRVEYVLI
jgi:predicted GNAT superfamily acetyltransferase